MKRHRRSLLADEKIRMTRTWALGLRDAWRGAGVDAFSGTAWFSVPGLVREAMEREFGEAPRFMPTMRRPERVSVPNLIVRGRI